MLAKLRAWLSRLFDRISFLWMWWLYKQLPEKDQRELDAMLNEMIARQGKEK